ncbi:MAG: outer membrane beta-barrel protein [Balneolaceae bacterium]|nr:outer membrane beta-barrel protein [Balneolaceae bacterium]MCH8548999.1 PorT family protein [Balneolaceae bacterium]
MNRAFWIVIPFCFSLFLISPNDSQAQSGISIGMKGGLNVADVSGGYLDGQGSRRGIHFGTVVEVVIPFLPVDLETGIYYSEKGAEMFTDLPVFGQGSEGNKMTKLDFLEIPILAKYPFRSYGSLTPHAIFGPYLGILLNAEVEPYRDDLGPFDFFDISHTVNTLDTGLIGGLGLDLKVGDATFNLQTRYSYGVRGMFTFADGQSRVFSVVTGFTF